MRKDRSELRDFYKGTARIAYKKFGNPTIQSPGTYIAAWSEKPGIGRLGSGIKTGSGDYIKAARAGQKKGTRGGMPFLKSELVEKRTVPQLRDTTRNFPFLT